MRGRPTGAGREGGGRAVDLPGACPGAARARRHHRLTARVDPAAVGRPMEAILSIQQGSAPRQATENLLGHAAALPETSA